MSDETVSTLPTNQKQGWSAAAAKDRIERQLLDQRRKQYEGDLRKKIEELNAAKSVYDKKRQEVEDFMADNADLND